MICNEDNKIDLMIFEGRTRVRHINKNSLEFDLIGVDATIANSLRRLMISEVATMAIEHVFIINNTSLIQDDVLASRLGMLPIRANPSLFNFISDNEKPSEKNTIVFRLAVSHQKTTSSGENLNVLSGSLEWLPLGSLMPEETNCRFSIGQTRIQPIIQPVHRDILLAVLAPGQEVILEAHCIKGYGKEHAKWSPVATSWYYFSWDPILVKKTCGSLAEELVRQLPGIIKLIGKKPFRRAVIDNARNHEILMAKYRRLSNEHKWAAVLQMRKVKNQFVFKIETSGAIEPWDIFIQAGSMLTTKIERVLKHW